MDLLQLQNDPAAFRSALLIDTDAGPKPFAECLAANDWQARDFAALDNGWRRAIGQDVEGEVKQRGWLERPRGHSKTLDLGIMAAWALFASRRRLSGIGAAGDQDQARLLRDSIGRLTYVNPWLAKLIEVQNYRVINPRTESTLEIITSDAPTSYGLTPDFIIADEVVHWKKRDLWDSLLSSAAKRASCMFVVITNAGLQDDWAWTLREAVRVDPLWYFSRQNGPVASWINADTLAEQERLLPSIAFRRLWLNEWTTGGGDALSPEVIAAAFKAGLRPMRGLDFMPVYGRLPEWEFVLGVDAGIVRDATALCALAVRRQHAGHGHIRLAKTKIWRPAKGQRVNLDEVENTVLDWHDEFKFKQINFDPWELRALASRLQSGGVGRMAGGPRFGKQRRESLPMVEVAPTGSNLQAQASALLETFNDRRIDLFEDADLRRDLNRMRVVEKSYGFRIESPRDEFGHGDMGSAFNLALLAASELAAKRVVVVGTGDAGQDRPMTPLERELAATRQRWESHQEHLQYLAGRPSEMAEGLARALRADGFSASDIRKRMGNG